MSATRCELLWLRRSESLIKVEFEDGIIVFDPDSGETHFLDDLTDLLLSEIDTQPVAIDDLVRRVAGAVELELGELDRISVALTQLREAELIESVEAPLIKPPL